MRSILHLRSQVDAARSLGKSSNSRQEQRELPTRPAPPIAQSDAGLLANTTPRRATSTRSQDVVAVGSRIAANVDDYPEAQHSIDRDDDEPGSSESEKPVIVIIHNRTVFRDCLA